MRKLLSFACVALSLGAVYSLWSCRDVSIIIGDSQTMPVDYVNPYMGNISHLLVPTYPTVHLPNSMLRVVPARKDYNSDQIAGLPILLTSHRGESAFSLSPFVHTDDSLTSIIHYTYDAERITPYSYEVYLQEPQAKVRYAPSHQSALYALSFEGDTLSTRGFVIHTPKGKLQTNTHAIEGYQQLNDSVRVYLYLETEQKPISVQERLSGNESPPDASTIIWHFAPSTEYIHLRYGISYISSEQAKRNVRREIQTFDIDMVTKAGRHEWDKHLGLIEIEGGSHDERSVFYTSLYRTYERMINISEDGRYFSASTGKVYDDGGIPFYTDDWIWDTYLAVHPLRVLIEPEREEHMLQSYIRMAEQTPQGWLPTFPEVTGDSHRMNGNHSIAPFADAYAKGLSGFDLSLAYEQAKRTMKEKSHLPWTRMPKERLSLFMDKHGYFPGLKIGERETEPLVTLWEKRQSVAVTLAACYDYWCLSQIAEQLGHDSEAEIYLTKAYNYRHLYNYKTGFFHPKDEQGAWIEPFDYEFSGGLGARDYYDENNAYTYRWDVKHNPADLIYLMGGDQAFIRNLDETFRTPLSKDKWQFYSVLPDQTGNVGQFSMGNEPSLHIPYLYNYAGAPWRTQRAIRRLLHSWFRNDLMGIPGDEDGGGLSAFVVFSMMGIYPTTPGLPIYNIGSPTFPRVKINLSKGKSFSIIANNVSDTHIYIQSASLNGKPLHRPWLKHSEIIEGGELMLEMGDRPNKSWGTQTPPPSARKIDWEKAQTK